jgi:hypothetical protein
MHVDASGMVGAVVLAVSQIVLGHVEKTFTSTFIPAVGCTSRDMEAEDQGLIGSGRANGTCLETFSALSTIQLACLEHTVSLTIHVPLGLQTDHYLHSHRPTQQTRHP